MSLFSSYSLTALTVLISTCNTHTHIHPYKTLLRDKTWKNSISSPDDVAADNTVLDRINYIVLDQMYKVGIDSCDVWNDNNNNNNNLKASSHKGVIRLPTTPHPHPPHPHPHGQIHNNYQNI